MGKNTSVVSICVLGIVGWFSGCGTLSLFDSGASSGSDFIGISLASFNGTRMLPVREDSIGSESTDVALPEDLLVNAPDEVTLVLSASEVSLTVEEDPDLLNPAGLFAELHAAVTFGIALANLDACASEIQIGPFELAVVDGIVVLDAEALHLTSAARSVVRNGRLEICAQTQADFDGVVGIGKLVLEFGKLGPNEDKVDLCHIPPGDPENRHSISVGTSAVDMHLAHGDFLGACEPDEEDGDGTLDSDGDGVTDEEDSCASTPTGEVPDATGCSCSQRDSDSDGVADCDDNCPDTASGVGVDANGCPVAPLDVDNDGVVDGSDMCPNTPLGEVVDANGCSCSQLDEDADGVTNCDDFCPNTPVDAPVDSFGCETATADAGQDATLDEVSCVTLQGSARGGTPPYTYFWSAPGWAGSLEQNPSVVPSQTTTYTLTVTDFSFPSITVTDTVTVTINTHEGLLYTIVDLGSLSTNSSYPAGINDSADVVGFYFTNTLEKHAFLYSDGTMSDLGSLGGGEASATDINNAGQVVGESKTADGDWHAFLWDSTNGMQDLGTLGGASSVANAINQNSDVVGSSATGSATHAFIYSGGVMKDVGTLDLAYSEAHGLNDLGTVVGTLLRDGSNPEPLIYDGSMLLTLSSPLLSANRAWAINNSGLLIGHAWEIGEYRSFLHVCDTTVDLGALEGFPKTSTWGANEAGQIVGSVSADTSTLFHAFVYTGGRIRNLNDILVDGEEWEYLTAAFAVNSAGQITGYGRINGQFRGFLMTPVP